MALDPRRRRAMIAAAGGRRGRPVRHQPASLVRGSAPGQGRDRQGADRRSPALATVEVLGWRGPEYFAMDAWRGTAAGEGGGVLVNQAVHQLDLVRGCSVPRSRSMAGWATSTTPRSRSRTARVAMVRFVERRPGHDHREQLAAPRALCADPRPRHERRLDRRRDRRRIHLRRRVVAAEHARNDLWTIPGEEARPDAGRPSAPPSPMSISRATTTSSSCATSSRRSATVARPP